MCLASISQAQLLDDSTSSEVRDDHGRVQYQVVLKDDAADAFSKVAPDVDELSPYHPSALRNLTHSMEADYGFHATKMTSGLVKSFGAFLTEHQVARLSADPRVDRIEVNRRVVLDGTGPVWFNTVVFNQMFTWARQAILSPSTGATNGTMTVYVLDSGIGDYGSELNVIHRVNAIQPTSVDPAVLIGCFPHSSHVAGIIGASGYSSGAGVVGVDSGVRMVSVSLLDPGTSNSHILHRTSTTTGQSVACNMGASLGTSGAIVPPVITSMDVQDAVQWIHDDILSSGHVAVVNASQDDPDGNGLYDKGGTLGQLITTLVTPSGSYKGALFVQSAGNQYQDACTHAYNDSTKAAIVVGALTDHGQAVSPANGGFVNSPYAGSEAGSNFGSCVTMWAGGNVIQSTFATSTPVHINISSRSPLYYVQDSANPTPYHDLAYLSGTSMSAPQVAGLAAYLAESQGLTTPAAIKQAVVNTTYNLGSVDAANLAIRMPSIQPTKPPANP
jgi:subtilisin family serine protease